MKRLITTTIYLYLLVSFVPTFSQTMPNGNVSFETWPANGIVQRKAFEEHAQAKNHIVAGGQKKVLPAKGSAYDQEVAQAEIRMQETYLISAELIGALLLGTSLLFGCLYWKTESLRKREKFLLQEQHHRVKNNLQALSSLINLQSRSLADSQARNVLRESQLRIQAMMMVHGRLYTGHTVDVHARGFLEDLTRQVVETYGMFVHIECSIQDIILSSKEALPVGLIVNELISNACKYAFPDHPHPALHIALVQEQESKIILEVKDNGPGMNSQQKQPATFGLRLIQMQAKQLKATYSYKKEAGTVFIMAFSPNSKKV